jgi:hypothetical protein
MQGVTPLPHTTWETSFSTPLLCICITHAIRTFSSPVPWIFGHPHYEVQSFTGIKNG